MEPLVVEVVRGGVVEARHRVHGVAVADGKVVESFGDPRLVTHMRSAAKPIQAVPLARARPDVDDVDLAIASASHLARTEQLTAVRSLLARAPAEEADLDCGPADPARPSSVIEHNCSGKHAGMLALCRASGWPIERYRLAEHPCQRAMLAQVAAAAELEPERIGTGVDGCGVVAFALPLDRMAHAFGRVPALDGGERVAAAMRAHPDLVRGPGAPDTELMRAFPGWIAKGGAEGVLCAASPEGLGIALKVEDGSARALQPALARILGRLGYVAVPDEAPIENAHGEIVAAVRAT